MTRLSVRTTCVLLGATILSPSASAEPGDAAEDDGLFEEILVTATYRQTKLLDTPLAITALDEDALTDKGVLNMQSLSSLLRS